MRSQEGTLRLSARRSNPVSQLTISQPDEAIQCLFRLVSQTKQRERVNLLLQTVGVVGQHYSNVLLYTH